MQQGPALASLILLFGIQGWAASCSPPKLAISSQQVLMNGRFGDQASPPPATATVRITTLPEGKTIHWKASSSTPSVTLSRPEGDTPADLVLTFDLQAMQFGLNTGMVEVVAGEQRGTIAFQYTLLERLLVSPSPTVELNGRMGDESSPLVTSTALKIGSETDKRSIRWQATCTASWLTLSDMAGGTPSRVVLNFDPQAMKFGANTTSVEFTTEHDRQTLAVSYALLGRLDVSPKTTVELVGKKGEAKSSARTIQLSSPGKDGLEWKIASEDPWILIDPQSGVTPGSVTVTAEFGNMTRDISGRILVTAGNTWAGSSTALPVAIKLLDPALVRKQLSAKQDRIRAEFKAMKQEPLKLTAILKGEELADADAVVSAVKELSPKMLEFQERIAPSLDELEAFLDQNADYTEELGFSDVRKELDGHRKELKKASSDAGKVTRSLRDARVDIHGNGEWQAVNLEVKKGDHLLVRAEGTWTLGMLAGLCDAEGMHGESAYKLFENAPFGCLLVAAGDALVAFGEDDVEVESGGGRLVARCNDSDFANNSGTIHVRVIAFGIPK